MRQKEIRKHTTRTTKKINLATPGIEFVQIKKAFVHLKVKGDPVKKLVMISTIPPKIPLSFCDTSGLNSALDSTHQTLSTLKHLEKTRVSNRLNASTLHTPTHFEELHV